MFFCSSNFILAVDQQLHFEMATLNFLFAIVTLVEEEEQTKNFLFLFAQVCCSRQI